MSKTKSHPKTCSYHTVKQTNKQINITRCRNWPDLHLQQEDTGFIYGYTTAVCYIGQLLLLCSVLHGVPYYNKMHFYLSCAWRPSISFWRALLISQVAHFTVLLKDGEKKKWKAAHCKLLQVRLRVCLPEGRAYREIQV